MIVTEGLEGGEKVIISGFAKLRPEMVVEPTDATAEKGIVAMFKKQGMME
ncbi:MAG: hypothetical protein P8X39_11385 [Desulfofustis sp.]